MQPLQECNSTGIEGSDQPRDLAEQIGAFRRAALPDLLLHVGRASAGLDLSVIQIATLYLLDAGERPSLRELAARVDRSLSATSRLVDQLVMGGLVDRCEDARDRRTRRLELTARGRELLRGLERTRAAAQLDVIRHLTADERQTVVEAMALLATAARRRTDDHHTDPAPSGARDTG